jgi:hypothetical protein
MSLEVLLIPIGLAALAALKESRSTDLCEKCKATRITDQALLVQALTGMGVSNLVEADGRLTANSRFGSVTFQRIGATFLGRVDHADEAVTAEMLSELDRSVGEIAQIRSMNQIRERASELGLTLLAERNENGTMQLVFEQAS